MEPAGDKKNSDLLVRIAEGDERAFSMLFDQYKDIFYTAALYITKSESRAEELLQDVFLIIWLKREQLSAIDDFKSYFFTVAKNEAFKGLKKAVKNKGTVELSEHMFFSLAETEHPFGLHEYKDSLQKAMEYLSPQQKQVYRLVREQGLSREEAARALNIGQETVKWHMKEAIKNIRAFLIKDLKILWLLMAFVPEILNCRYK
jgi:RNA polymerase sigma factor (sigma-70 family)